VLRRTGGLFYAAKIAEALELGPERIEDVRSAALLHDIGKLDISRELLYKAARLTEEEFSEMREHVERGAGILEPIGGNQIPLEARIIAALRFRRGEMEVSAVVV
jgi:HD-GYP domain-containing protein (c-di-GMP phosphodiesterase class II)